MILIEYDLDAGLTIPPSRLQPVYWQNKKYLHLSPRFLFWETLTCLHIKILQFLPVVLQFSHGLRRRKFSHQGKRIQGALAQIEFAATVFPVTYGRRADTN